MIRARRAMSGTVRNQEGFSLPELVIAMLLFSILAVLVLTAFTSFVRTFNDDRVATTNTSIAATGMNELTRIIRAATSVPVVNADDLPAFAYANKEKLILYAYIDVDGAAPAPIKVQFEVNPTTRELVETRWGAHPKAGYPTYWEFNTTPTSVRVIARKIMLPATGENPMFKFYQIDSSLNPVAMTVPVTGITAANLTKIAVVRVTMKVQSDPSDDDPVLIENQVGVPNLGISRLGLS